jgi:hypothetical protein
MVGVRRRRTAIAAFALLALVAELTGRSLTARVDRALHVAPLAAQNASYYPFLLAAVKIVAALALAALAFRIARARATSAAAERVLAAVGHRRIAPAPRLRLSLSPRLWLASFVATSSWYLLQTDFDRVYEGRWPLLAPWLHTYALPVFAVLAVVLALGWGAARRWLAELDQYTAATVACARRLLRGIVPPARRVRPDDDHGPRRLFGLAFESRPPPLLA